LFEIANTLGEFGVCVFKFKNSADSLESDSLGTQPSDLAKLSDVSHRVAARLATGSSGHNQTHAVVLSERLGMHEGKFGRNSDCEHRSVFVYLLHDYTLEKSGSKQNVGTWIFFWQF
jgi:hypothetical protein